MKKIIILTTCLLLLIGSTAAFAGPVEPIIEPFNSICFAQLVE